MISSGRQQLSWWEKVADCVALCDDWSQNMYEEGDEDMKRTIAKAWSESREKNAAAGF